MKLSLRHNYRLGIAAASVALLAVGGLVFGLTTTHALDQGGGYSTSGGCSNANGKNPHNICTDNGFGWTLYHTDGSVGRPDFFKVDSWNTVSSTCSYAGGVYIFEVGGKPKGNGTVYSEAYPMNIIWLGYNPYDPGQSYWNANYRGDDYNTVQSRYYTNLGGSRDRWQGDNHSLEWFCYDINPKWSIGVTTSASVNGAANTTVAEVGDTITWKHTVTDQGPSPTNKAVNYTANNKQDMTGASPGNWSMPAGTWSSSNTSPPYTVKASDFGKNLCRSTTASPINQDGGSAESPDSCVKIVKKPKVQVYGGDVSAGRAMNGSSSATSLIVGSQTISNNITFGSWGEYGLVASGAIQGAASGAAYYQNGLANSSSACDYSKLSITNTSSGTACTANSIGSYSNVGTIPDVAGQFAVQLNSTPVYGGGDVSDAQYKRVEQVKNNSVTITGGQLQKGQWLVINAPNATVNITGDITYTTSKLSSIDDIPQLVIIANTINIDQGVSEVDAWLVASGSSGTIHTCTQGAGVKLYATICNNALNVYGPVMAKHLYLERTAGAAGTSAGDKAFGDPAEVFHLRPDAYLWGAARSLEGLHVSVAATSDLPPRF